MGALDRIFRRRQEQQRPLESYVRGLFAAGEQGVWFDPSDLTTLFQDAAGTTPVYLPGQGQVDPPVGLLLDKRRLLATGGTLPAPDFTTGAGWARSAAVSASSVLSFTTTGVGGMYKTANNYLTAGKLYDFSVTYTKSDAVSAFSLVNIDNGSASSPVVATGTAASGVLTARWFAPTSGGMYFRLAGAGTVTINAIVVREVPGNHAYQSTATSRPTLSARYNVLTSTENLADPSWTINGTCVRTGAFATSPTGTLTATRIQLGTLATDEVRQTFSTPAGAGIGYTAAIWLKSNTGSDQQVRLKNTHINVVDNFLIITVTPVWQRFSLTVANGASPGTGQLLGITNTAGGLPKDVLAWGADLRIANDGVGLPEYQRVVDASTYDTAGFPLYLRFDGVDDWMQTASVDFGATDKATLWAAIRKLSDAGTGMLIESSTTATAGTNNGTFHLAAPNPAAGDLSFKLVGGAAPANAVVAASGYPAPVSAIATYQMDIGGAAIGDEMKIRVNGVAPAVTYPNGVTPAGGGNLGNHAIYIGRRAGTSLPFNGRLYGLIVRGAATPDPTISRVERYLNAKSRAY